MDTAAAAERGEEEIVVVMHEVCFFLAWGILLQMDEGYTQDLDNGGSLGVLTIRNGSLPAHLESGDTKVCVVLFSWSLESGGSMR